MSRTLNVGDKVVIYSAGFRKKQIGEVTKLTKTQISLDNGKRYMKSTYNEVGGTSCIREGSKEYIENVMQENTIQDAFSLMKHLNIMSYEMACDIIKVFEKYEKKEGE